MLASEKMARRATLFAHLTSIDIDLKLAFGMEPSNRVTANARKLLNKRAQICDAMIQVGYTPWDVPADIEESKAI
jgi:hypothetical protein